MKEAILSEKLLSRVRVTPVELGEMHTNVRKLNQRSTFQELEQASIIWEVLIGMFCSLGCIQVQAGKFLRQWLWSVCFTACPQVHTDFVMSSHMLKNIQDLIYYLIITLYLLQKDGGMTQRIKPLVVLAEELDWFSNTIWSSKTSQTPVLEKLIPSLVPARRAHNVYTHTKAKYL